ncbi:MAG: hypothetical protein HY658_09790, partial [Actinobacteria bacterium]|nr:hypothetical protein [Actinomycetota bacterium]
MPRRAKGTGGAAFTVAMPRELPARREGEHWWMQAAGRELRLSNLDKVFWPDEGYTKGDLVAYYFNAAELILPYLAGRPLTMKRMPDGIAGDFFYEKSAPRHTPDWMPRCDVASDDPRKKGKPIDYLMVDDLAGLLFMVNLGCVEFHPLHARCGRIEFPDYAFFDLDPFDVPFEDVRTVALHVRVVLDQLGLRSYPKTSGATGMQIYVPIHPRFSHDLVRDFVGEVGRLIRRADPDRVTMEWQVSRRTGKVFIDHNMNRAGANISAAYSMRPEPRATVSTPVTWDEVEGGITPQDFRIDNVWERWAEAGDLFADVIGATQDLAPALKALGLPAEHEPDPIPSERVGPPGERSRSDEAIARSK